MDTQPRLPPSIVLPQAPDAGQPYSFPIVASLAPVVGALAIWAMTQSPFTLAFAALGPIIAVASYVDSRMQSRRRRRREGVRFRRQLRECADSIDEQHARERAALMRLTPRSSQILSLLPGDPERWRGDLAEGVFVNLGLGDAASEVRIEGATRHADDEADAALAMLRENAKILRDAPIVVDAKLGIGVCGPAALANALARSILLQLGHLISPASGGIAIPGGPDWQWLGELPHPLSVSPDAAVRWRAGEDTITVGVASTPELLPVDCRVVLRVGGGRRVELQRHAHYEAGHIFEGEFLSVEEALRAAELLSSAARERGLVREAGTVSREFAALPDATASRGSLRCAFGWSEPGVFAVDLVADGPHAVIGGTTGSGKSELLLSWVLAMAASASPAQVNFLLVDFKGGSSFGLIERLPHVVGLITDLDERSARRALLSLRAELKYRERRLAEAAARSIDELSTGEELPRLVLVVDEFAAMVADFPELHELFADLAARGRSLGLHLILCTQRPAGVVRDAVLANAALRISLRVNNRADSVAVIGTGDATELPADRPGLALLSLAGGEPQPLQIARATAEDAERVADRWGMETGTIRRPWCDELPRILRANELAEVSCGLPIGLLDLPEQQRQETAVYDPDVDGNLLVVGGHQSGKSGLIATLHRAGEADSLPQDIEGAWDMLSAALDRVRLRGGGPRLLLIDDLDALISRYTEEYRAPFVEMLTELLRDGGSVGLHLVITARRLSAAMNTVTALCDARLVLRLPNRQEHLFAGGAPEGYVADAWPGSGEWHGSRVQLVLADVAGLAGVSGVSGTAPPTSRLDLRGRQSLLVVSRRAAEIAQLLRETTAGDVIELASTTRAPELSISGAANPGAANPTVVVADPETWQSQWGLLASLRSASGILFDGCTPAEFRAVSGLRRLPPPLSPLSPSQWLLEPDGTLTRVRLA